MERLPLPEDFFSKDALALAPALLGKLLVRKTSVGDIVGRITETEAYMGAGDAACHASDGKLTSRNQVMFEHGGVFYVYLIYGMYHCLNVVSGAQGSGEAVLIRGLEVVEGLEFVSLNRHRVPYNSLNGYQRKNLLNGPGKLCRGLALERSSNGAHCLSENLCICEGDGTPFTIETAKRVGIDYAGDAKNFLWRFIATCPSKQS